MFEQASLGESRNVLGDWILRGGIARFLSFSEQRKTLFIVLGFAGTALLLAAIGLYGVVAYTVAERTREFSIRVALGAKRADVLRLVMAEGTRLASLPV